MDNKPWYTSKTIIFGILFTVVHFAGLVGFGEYSPPTDLVSLLDQIGGLVAILLRLWTTRPIKGSPAA